MTFQSNEMQLAVDDCEYLLYEDGREHQRRLVQRKDSLDGVMTIPLFSAFKSHSLIIGLLVGFFVQFSTLGANFLLVALWENDLVTRRKSEIILLSLLWSGFTSFMAILTLGFLRSVITIVFRASVPEDRHQNAELLLEEVILHLECRFVVGALVGVCLAWTVTDILLGMNVQIVFSVVTLMISLLWCKLMMYCFAKDEHVLIKEPAADSSAISPVQLV